MHDYPLRGHEVHGHAPGRCDAGGVFEHAGGLRRDTWRLHLLRRHG